MSTVIETTTSPPAPQAPIHREPWSTTMAEQVILHGVSWRTYESLLADFNDRPSVRFSYDEGVLQIMVVSLEHEMLNRVLALLIDVLAEEMNMDILNAGSTTFKRKKLQKGFEPDTCFYIANAERMRGKKRVDLRKDPPPDLVIEIDITSPSLDKLPIYAAVRVPEVWRYDGQQLTIFRLEGGEYITSDKSVALPRLTSAVLSRFLEESQSLKRTVWLRRLRAWVRKGESDT